MFTAYCTADNHTFTNGRRFVTPLIFMKHKRDATQWRIWAYSGMNAQYHSKYNLWWIILNHNLCISATA
jgi:hypothetical protein